MERFAAWPAGRSRGEQAALEPGADCASLGAQSQEARRAIALLEASLEDRSSIVKTSAMQALADLARRDRALLPEVLDLLRIHARSGTPAMRARGRMLLKILEPADAESTVGRASPGLGYSG